MKRLLTLAILFNILFSCREYAGKATHDNQLLIPDTSDNKVTHLDSGKIFILDSTFKDSVNEHIQFTSAKYFSHFKTPIRFSYLKNNLLVDSIVQADFDMISWYGNRKDTIDLVAHVGEFETSALLVRFINGKPNVFFFRAPHSERNYLKINKTDSFSSQIEVPPVSYKLVLSQIPDTINKQVIFGYIDMKTAAYYDKRDTLEEPHKVQMRFYFRSQYRQFNR